MKIFINMLGVIVIGLIVYIAFVDDSFWVYLVDYVWNPFVDFLRNMGPGYW